ncbi:hypothetical protein JCM4914_21750 [Streptomyces platensis subsp. malvinus]
MPGRGEGGEGWGGGGGEAPGEGRKEPRKPAVTTAQALAVSTAKRGQPWPPQSTAYPWTP